MRAAGFEPTIPTNERPQTHAVERAVTGIGSLFTPFCLYFQSLFSSSILYHCISSVHHNSSALLLQQFAMYFCCSSSCMMDAVTCH